MSRPALLIFTALIALLLTVATLNWACRQQSRPDEAALPEERLNQVILIVVDTLRADMLSCSNQASPGTPNMDHLAADGIRFTQARSASPWTLPSICSILTGFPVDVHQVLTEKTSLPAALPTLAEYMKDAGFHTAAGGWNPLLDAKYQLNRGFDSYYIPIDGWFEKTGREKPLVPPGRRRQGKYNSTPWITEFALDYLAVHEKEDFFLWLHFMDPHLPYLPAPEFMPARDIPDRLLKLAKNPARAKGTPSELTRSNREDIQALYEGEVRWVDAGIGKILDRLEELGLYDQALILLTSDHGEEFWEHGGFEHGHSVYDELIQVPLIVKLPVDARLRPSGGTDTGLCQPSPERPFWTGVIGTTVSTQGILPLILDLFRIDNDDEYLKTVSLSPLIGLAAAAVGDEEPPVFSSGLLYGQNRETVIFDGIKYIRTPGTNQEELYDLRSDPGERVSLVSRYPGSVSRARSLLEGHHRRAGRIRSLYQVERTEIVLDEATRRELRALGYIE